MLHSPNHTITSWDTFPINKHSSFPPSKPLQLLVFNYNSVMGHERRAAFLCVHIPVTVLSFAETLRCHSSTIRVSSQVGFGKQHNFASDTTNTLKPIPNIQA